MFNTKLYSKALANTHFWIATLGILFYAIPLYFAGITQASMWKQFTPEGFLVYPNFLETVTQILPMYHIRAFGGSLYYTGVLLWVYNLYKTMKAGSLVANEEAEAVPLPVQEKKSTSEGWHRFLERKPLLFLTASLIVILIGGMVEIIPTYFIKSNVPTIESVKPYTPLELLGRDVYVSEGCYNCHSQMIRPFRSETERYGEYSKGGEAVYNHPFQYGSKRTGPDLAREGVKSGKLYKPDSWHYNHMIDPQKINDKSIMPPYPWLAKKDINMRLTPKKIRVMQTLGVPYPEGYDKIANDDLMKQAKKISDGLSDEGIDVEPTRQIVALIAYLQRLGTDIIVDK